jgi:transposase
MLTSAEVRGKWVLSVEDWAEIRRLYRAERMPIKVIARVVGCSKNTVRKALAAEGSPAYRRHRSGSVVDAVEPRIRELLQHVQRCRPRSSRNGLIGGTRSATPMQLSC